MVGHAFAPPLKGPVHTERRGKAAFKGGIHLALCQDSSDFATFRQLINTYHTYAPWKRSPGRKVWWLIESTGSELLGAIGVYSAVLTAKPRDDFIGWNRERPRRRASSIA